MGAIIWIAEKIEEHLVDAIKNLVVAWIAKQIVEYLVLPNIKQVVMWIVKKIGEYQVVLYYLIDYNSNIRTLEDQSKKLADKRNVLQQEVNAARRSRYVISSEVERQLTNVDKLNEGVGTFLEKDTKANRWCSNPKLRYSLSMKAKKMTEAIVELVDKPLSSIEGFKNFESRTSIMREVLEALRDDNINMIALCGMGGIGKTTMAKEVKKRVIKVDNLFDEVAMAVVSQNPELEKIQGELAVTLSLKLDAESLSGKAQQLCSRIMKGARILVILDDVWEGLNLGDIGIPHGGEHKLCKILLTSRNEEACRIEMRAQKLFPIKVLIEEEAWNLFREMAGSCIDSIPDLRPIAEKVAKECGGLPVAIVTVGRALEKRSKDEWIAALQQLQKSIPENIRGVRSKVYSSIELSYSYLKSNEAKSCFLLCCLFPENYDIPIEYLVRFGMGRRLFKKIDTVAEARIRVHALVQNLKRSFLLIDSEKKEHVKMHDVVRDVAIEIASKNEHGFLVRCDDKMEEWPEEDAYERYAAISLVFKDFIRKYPDVLECPKLELLQLSCNGGLILQNSFPANFFEGMNALKVLTLRHMSIQSLQSSIQALQNLRTLNLDYCELQEDVSAIGKLEKLEILSFFGTKIKELPREIGHLKYLRLLDLGECRSLKRIPRGVLSGLSKLEELHMRNSFKDWESMEGKPVGTNASLAELMPVSHRLMALDICVPNANELWPKDLSLKNQIIRFNISIEEGYYEGGIRDMYLFQNSLVLDVDITNSSPLRQLLEYSDNLELRNMKNLRNILYELDQKGFPRLKVLVVKRCDVEYLVDATSEMTPQVTVPLLEFLELSEMWNLKDIYHSQLPAERSFSSEQIPPKSMMYLQNAQPPQLASFGNLRSIKLCHCIHLKNVFSLSIARGLIQLKSLKIEKCREMEEIFSKEREEDDTLILPRLTYLELYGLSSLIGFCKAINAVELPQSSHVKAAQPSLNIQEVGSGSNELITSQMGKMKGIQHEQHHTRSFSKSRSMPHKLFSSKSVQWAPNLDQLVVYGCDSLEAVFDLEGLKLDKDGQAIESVLAKLETLILQRLTNLTHVWKNVPQGIQGFQNLTSIELINCQKIRYLFPPSITKLLAELQRVVIYSCNVMENIVQRGQDDGKEDARNINIVFPKVNSFMITDLPNFVSFCFNAYSFEWPSMKKLRLNHCPKLKTFGSEINIRLDSTTQVRGTTKKSRGSSSLRGADQPDFHGQTPHHLVNKEVTLTRQEKPSVSKDDNQTKIWSCFPSNLIGGLQNLEKFEANQCNSLEVIFQLEGSDVQKSHDFKALNNLTELVLQYLPKLVYIWKMGPQEITGFQNLKLLEVCDCNSLAYLFSPSIAKLLVKLEKIIVDNCQKMKRILAEPREEEKEDVIVFTQVNSLSLENLPELECFCSEANIAFEWPSLEEISVFACQELKMFVPTQTVTPKLKGVLVDKYSKMHRWKGDLNATIQHIFKGEEEEEKENPSDPCHVQEPKVDLGTLPLPRPQKRQRFE